MHKFYYKQFAPFYRSFSKLIGPVANDLQDGGRFYFNLARTVGMESYIFRQGEWSDPFDCLVEQSCSLPDYDPNFNMSFTEVSDLRAQHIKNILSTGRPVVLMWSGGIDSTVAFVSLLKNLTDQELSQIKISMSSDTLLEYPSFFEKYVYGKFEILDSEQLLVHDYLEKYNAYCISSDTGDCIFGAELGNKLYPRMKFVSDDVDLEKLYSDIANGSIHYSRYKDIIINYFNRNFRIGCANLKESVLHPMLSEIKTGDEMFGEMFYEKIVKNIETSSVPIHSLHDFFWWTIFNGRFIHCGLRTPLTYSLGDNKERLFQDCAIQWFSSDEYQKWSMVNNNNGQKLAGPTQGLYKIAAKKYIYEFTKDKWHLDHKMKIISSPNILRRNWKKNVVEFDPLFGLDENYNTVRLGTPQVDNFVLDKIFSYKLDW